ncbi:lipopolysaccharide core heptose(I) kinase RfaP [Methylophilus sp. OH31]|uniref:lipopolysaccharide core heptose(I) kinase RfaP n=1 Tax=Methylophilus sp. OH31 TaxID=1387312 RepID=UPI001F5736D3|nr:lipopolysaccharide core heptose(I) kinase RfaP [Methylophilus sp. OH31]
MTDSNSSPSQQVHLEPGYSPSISGFDDWMALQGEVFRSVKDRQTHKVMLDGESIFIKKHYGVGWGEILKNLLSLKWPVLGARNEWQAIHKLDEIGIATTPLLAYGERGTHPAHKQSFVVTRDLGDIVTLETLCEPWLQQPPSPYFKRQLIAKVAELARCFHANGMWHRDFYLCHFALPRSALKTQDLQLHLMDLHRVEIHAHLPEDKRLKDLAGLYFSAMHIGLTQRDVLRFLKHYYQQPLRQVLMQHQFLHSVAHRASQLDAKFQRKRQAGVAM